MAQDSSHIVYGPEDRSGIPKESVGEYILNCLKERNADYILYEDAVTGEVLTSSRILQDSIKATAVWKGLGLEKGDVITMFPGNKVNFCVPVLSALYLGITVNPLNPSYTTGEIRHALLFSKPKLILCTAKNVHLVLEVKQELDFIETVLVVDAHPEGYADTKIFGDLLENVQVNLEGFQPEPVDFGEHVAFILLSSGTTGLRKGVLLTHQNITSTFVHILHPAYENCSKQHTALQVLPNFHIYGMLVQLSAIVSGMKVILLEKFMPHVFLDSIQKYKVTKLFLVPPLVLFLARSPLVSGYDVTTVKDILYGGAPLSLGLHDELLSRTPTAVIRQLYGLTETTGTCTCAQPDFNKHGSVGTLVPGIAAKVWNADVRRVLGPLEIGELCFQGPMIMKGYVGKASDEGDCIDEDGFYHTGDVGSYDEDHHFFIVDRLKELIKYKGFQVAPAESEGLILTHPAVNDCGVVGIPDERDGQLPLAFVVRQRDEVVTEKDIVDYVAGRTSVEKRLHGGVIFIDEVPKSASGKILRRKLFQLYDTAQ